MVEPPSKRIEPTRRGVAPPRQISPSAQYQKGQAARRRVSPAGCHWMNDSAQVTDAGATISMIAAVSSRPTKKNKRTCSRMPTVYSSWRSTAG